MARIRSVDFLPEIFKTDVNREFLGATLDQLLQQPKLKKTQGYIGRRSGSGATFTDSYVLEPTVLRTNYQLEPGVVFNNTNGEIEDLITYPELIDSIAVNGGNVTRHDRLFASNTYSWHPNIDLDKFINYSQYYWLPSGPEVVDVQSGEVALIDNFDVTDSTTYFNLTGYAGNNPTITLMRGGSYTFDVNQLGNNFWIQTEPGDGTLSYSPNLSSRDVLGVINNGDDVGTITFNVPLDNAQIFYYTLNSIGTVDLATTDRFDSINRKFISEFNGIDGITDLENKTLVFLNTQEGDSYDLGWQRVGQFGNEPYDTEALEPTTYIDSQSERYGLYRILIVRPDGSSDEDAYIELVKISDIAINDTFSIGNGTVYSNKKYYKNASGFFEEIPLLSSTKDTLYYQSGSNLDQFGIINLIDPEESPVLQISEILGKATYTSPNGVVFTNGLKIKFASDTNPASYKNQEYIVEGVGTAIQLVPMIDLVTPEIYIETETEQFDLTPYDTSGWDSNLNSPLLLDYITIKRNSPDLNAWSRSNRWFHKDVVEAAAEYNNTIATFDNDYRAKRPIIEFDNGLRLFNMGTEGKKAVDIIDLTQTDALSNVNGSTGYSVDGYTLTSGSRIIFAADTDNTVRNRIYTVNIVDPDDNSTEYGEIILLEPADDSVAEIDQNVVCLSGNTLQGKMFRYNGTAWVETQQKTGINQEPLFDVFDSDGYSLSDSSLYPSSTFRGSKVFSYKRGTGVNDPVLEFPLSYLNIDNLGDIVFDNNFYNDTFIYVSNGSSATINVSNGFTRSYTNRTAYTTNIGWISSAEKNWQRQVFTFEYSGSDLLLDVTARTDLNVPSIKVYVNNKFIQPSDYFATSGTNQTQITLNAGIANIGDFVQVKIISNQPSTVAYYEIPSNIESNVFNGNTSTFTLGTVRNHYTKMVENITEFSGIANGANNSRDLSNFTSYGDVIIQNSSPISSAAYFLKDNKSNFFAALDYAARNYEKIKYLILDWVANNDVYGLTEAEILDAALNSINVGKSTESPFYLTDTIPFGGDFTETRYTITPISTSIFNTINVYDFTKASNTALLVYQNDTLLTKDYDYTVATDGPRITLLITPTVGDIIKIKEYSSTRGSFVPETPTKLGMFPKFEPKKYVDDTYVEDRIVIQGHDGSITIGFGDVRDDVLLEFEKRIFNNIKINSEIPILPTDLISGKFRNTDYTDSELTELLSMMFLNWVGWHKLDYKQQNYDATSEWTWNYTQSSSSLDGSTLKGNWRGIYKNYYDTDRPHTHPWEMLGFSEKPSWWNTKYGPAPYTSGNDILWNDLELGYNRNDETYNSVFARPGLSQIIPVDSEGNLKNPFEVLVGNYDQSSFRKSWLFGDVGPVENAWRRSSNWPYALQKLYALTKPAEFFALMVDRDLYKYSSTVQQYVYNNRYRLDVRDITVTDETTPKHSYINWIVSYNRNEGITSSTNLQSSIENIDVRLCYRFGGFTDKNYLKIFSDKSSPDSSNTSLLIPDESYQLILHKNQTFGDLQYSSVMVQKTSDGYAVYGNSQTELYFRIMESTTDGNYETITVGSRKVRIPRNFTNRVARVPYGYTFTNINSVVDFLVSYGKFLELSGLVFDDIENNYTLNWSQMAQEFIYWADGGWSTGSLINLNPAASQLKFERVRSIVDDINNLAVNEQPLDQNRQPLVKRDYAVTRLDNQFTITSLNDKSISYLRLKSTNFEHVLVLDNTSIFNDLIYQPLTGLRQNRLRIDGFKTFEWNGQLDAQGFILNQDNVATWNSNKSYNKGDIVRYKNSVWTASTKVQPAEQFDLDEWTKIDYDIISKGLLPNISVKAEQMSNYYNNQTVNLESDVDLLGLGITGFRSRDYLESLNLDDVSQVNVYSNLIQQKGTALSTTLFRNVEFDKEKSEYDIYENWAVQRAVFGANDNKRFVEFSLDKDTLLTNPGLVEVNYAGTVTDADQLVNIDNIYKQSVLNSTPDIFPILTDVITDTNLPTAGYVNADDIDIKLFDLSDLSLLSDQLNLIKDGAYIWVGKSNAYDWNVYRASTIQPDLISVVDNLNGTLNFEFNGAHKLSVGNLIVIKFFSDLINGAVQVLRIQDYRTIVVSGTLAGEIDELTGRGITYKLSTARLTQASDIAYSEYNNNLFSNDKIWVDADINNKWSVYQKTEQFSSSSSQLAPSATSDTRFGTQVVQGLNGTGAIVSAPGDNFNVGALHGYAKDGSSYVFVTSVKLDSSKATELGRSLAMSTNWAVAGASTTLSIPVESTAGDFIDQGLALVIHRNTSRNTFTGHQILVDPSAPTSANKFGTSVAISEDENWIYVGAPGKSQVHCYQKVEHQTQAVTYIADGNTKDFSILNQLKVDNQSQLTVSVDGVSLATTSFVLTGNTITIYTTPDSGSVVVITRKNSITFNGDGSTERFTEIGEIYTATNIDSFRVFVNGVLQRPYYDYSFNNDSSDPDVDPSFIEFAVAPAIDDTVIIRSDDYYKYVNTITGPANEEFGTSISTTSDGQQIIIGAPTAASEYRYITGNGVTRTFSVPGLTAGLTIESNNNEIAPSQFSYNTTTGILTFASAPGNGQKLTIKVLSNSGKTYVYERVVERYIVLNSAIKTYNVLRDIDEYNNVYINGVKQLTEINNVNGKYQISTVANRVEFNSNTTLTEGDNIDVDINEFNLVQTLTLNNNNQSAYFGTVTDICRTDCSMYISAPKDNYILPEAGCVTRFINRSRVFGTITGTTADPTVTVGHGIRINNIDVIFTNTTLEQVVVDINNKLTPNVIASITSDNKLKISVINTTEAPSLSKMSVMPGIGSAYSDLGLEPLEFTQTIRSPRPEEYSEFGSSIHVDFSATNLIVGAHKASTILPITFDDQTTFIDSNSTKIVDVVEDSGAVYTYDLLPSSSSDEPGNFVFGQQVYDASINELDQFGYAVDFTGDLLLVTSPGHDTVVNNIGRLVIFENSANGQSWTQIQNQPQSVDNRLIDTIYMYDSNTQKVDSYLDFIDPINNKLLGVVQQNIDFIGAYDPAEYNQSQNNLGAAWAKSHVGNIWWDTTNLRYVEYNQDDIVYSSKNWGALFDGSSVDVYEWIESTVPPAQYTGSGLVKNVNEYTLVASLDSTRTVISRYYFWVKNTISVNKSAGKTLSTSVIANYIENPRSSGIPYAALIRKNVVALYNIDDYLKDTSILHIEYSRTSSDNEVYFEYDLIRENNANDFLSSGLYRKLQDSFCGVDTLGNLVPDINLSITDRYGVDFRPRKSMFEDRYKAAKIYLNKANNLIKLSPFAELRTFNILASEEPIPAASSGEWDVQVANQTELEYQDLLVIDPGYRYLVLNDENNNGLWTIYEVDSNKEFNLIRVQSYDTSKYWDYIDWYETGYDSLSKPDQIVDTYSELLVLTVPTGTLVKVRINGNGKWELYNFNGASWDRVGLENGTVQFKDELWDYTLGRNGFDTEVFDVQYFDQEPVLELRQIIKAINEELLVGDFLLNRNQLLISVFNYILAEQGTVEWLYKTSLIDVNHNIRDLEQYAVYRKDNQDFVEKYIKESKPYHVKIKEFLLTYDGLDLIQGNVFDYDVPTAFDTTYNRFVSPILDDGLALLETDVSNRLTNDLVWSTRPWADWYNNYKLTIDSITVTQGGTGYTTIPTVTVTGDATDQAVLQAQINSAGQVSAIIVVSTGSGYRSTPIITISGGNGSGATAAPIMKNDLVRSIKTTIKYDRYEYETQVVDWEADTVYDQDQLVRFNNKVYKAINADGSSASAATFDPAEYELVDASTLSGLDRTYGLYVADVNKPGRDLALLINGLDYPGVQVKGPSFGENTGYDVGNFDINPFDNFDIGPEGLPTYSETILDADYRSLFTDTYLGTRTEDINVDGAAFIDEYNSHAPEELIPGSIFDTLDFTIRTRPGFDYTGNGHGFEIKTKSYEKDTVDTYSFAGAVEHPIDVIVFNITTGTRLYKNVNYTINWAAQTITLTSGALTTEVIKLYVYEIGGGNQIYRANYNGAKVSNQLSIPVTYGEIDSALIHVNGNVITNYSYSETVVGETKFSFDATYTSTDYVSITLFGEAVVEPDSSQADYAYSYPDTQLFTANGLTSSFTLTGNINYTARENVIVELNGRRLRPADGVRRIGDGVTNDFYLSDGTRTGTDQSLLTSSDVVVYVNDTRQELNTDYTLSPNDESSERYVSFVSSPLSGSTVDIYIVSTADYTISGTTLTIGSSTTLVAGDKIAVTTWNDPRQQDVLTSVYVGPKEVEVTGVTGFDQYRFDQGAATDLGEPDYDVISFDQIIGTSAYVNVFELYRTITNSERMWVTLDGRRLLPGVDYVLATDGQSILISGGAISASSVIAITTFTNSIVPDSLDVRIFQDMKGNAAVYRITPETSTNLTEILEPWHDTIYVDNASKLGQPNLSDGILGVVNINGERITYRERDIVNNTISGLRRGTAGTSIQRHNVNALVEDQSRGNLLNQSYSLIWYSGTPSNGIPLQKQLTYAAKFFRGE